jgi:uncharacterized protein
MTLKEQLTHDLHDAMRSGDERKKIALRMLLAAIKNAEIGSVPDRVLDQDDPGNENVQPDVRSRGELDDEGVLNVVKREVKQRKDSIDAFSKAGRQDLVDKEQAELDVLSAYMPAQMSREDIEVAARAVIAETGAKGPSDKGKVMPKLVAQLKDLADGRDINAVVTQLLQPNS